MKFTQVPYEEIVAQLKVHSPVPAGICQSGSDHWLTAAKQKRQQRQYPEHVPPWRLRTTVTNLALRKRAGSDCPLTVRHHQVSREAATYSGTHRLYRHSQPAAREGGIDHGCSQSHRAAVWRCRNTL